ncbi:MAG: DUF6941 family protein [Gemmatimonadota bacterium]
MDVTFAVVADYANVSREGKLNVMGIFDRVFTRQVPGRFPPMQLVIRLEAEYDELDTEHSVRVQLRDPGGEPIFDIDGAFTPRGGQPGQKTGVNHVLHLGNVPLHRAGSHRILVWIDGALKREVPIHVVQPPDTPRPDTDADTLIH